jgi:hypothetical protein
VFRFVQLTPAGSGCSIAVGLGITDAVPGSARDLHLVVPDIEAARTELSGRGVEVSPATRKLKTGTLGLLNCRPRPMAGVTMYGHHGSHDDTHPHPFLGDLAGERCVRRPCRGRSQLIT